MHDLTKRLLHSAREAELRAGQSASLHLKGDKAPAREDVAEARFNAVMVQLLIDLHEQGFSRPHGPTLYDLSVEVREAA